MRHHIAKCTIFKNDSSQRYNARVVAGGSKPSRTSRVVCSKLNHVKFLGHVRELQHRFNEQRIVCTSTDVIYSSIAEGERNEREMADNVEIFYAVFKLIVTCAASQTGFNSIMKLLTS